MTCQIYFFWSVDFSILISILEQILWIIPMNQSMNEQPYKQVWISALSLAGPQIILPGWANPRAIVERGAAVWATSFQLLPLRGFDMRSILDSGIDTLTITLEWVWEKNKNRANLNPLHVIVFWNHAKAKTLNFNYRRETLIHSSVLSTRNQGIFSRKRYSC